MNTPFVHKLSNGCYILPTTGSPELDQLFKKVFREATHPESPFPVYSIVRIKMTFHELVNYLTMKDHLKLQEARGYALEILDGPNQVLGLQNLSDDRGIFHPYVSIMTNSGAMFAFRQDV